MLNTFLKKNINFYRSNKKISSLANLLIIFFIILCFSSCTSDKNKIIFATSAKMYPFEYYENNELAGFDIELGKLIAQELGKKAVFKDIHYYNIFTSLKNKHVDSAISSLIFTEKRAEQFLFSNSYYEPKMVFIYNNKKNKFKKLSDLKGKKINPIYGSIFSEWFEKYIGNVEKIYFSDEMSSIKALENSAVDAILLDKFEAISLTKKNSEISILNIPEKLEPKMYFALIFRKDDLALQSSINNVLLRLKENGKLDALKEKFLIE